MGGVGDGDYIYAFQRIVMPIALEFQPDLVIGIHHHFSFIFLPTKANQFSFQFPLDSMLQLVTVLVVVSSRLQVTAI